MRTRTRASNSVVVTWMKKAAFTHEFALVVDYGSSRDGRFG
jgi:hypothetical protein